MKNSLDRYSFNINTLIIISIIFLGCSPCKKTSFNDFKNGFDTISFVKDVVENVDFLNNNSFPISLSELKNELSNQDYEILRNLDFKQVSNTFNNTLVFEFKSNSESNEINCIQYLFYNLNKNERHKIAYFEQFAECRDEFLDFNKDWTYVSRRSRCGD